MCLSLNGNFVSTLQPLTEKMLKGKNYNSQYYLKLSLLYMLQKKSYLLVVQQKYTLCIYLQIYIIHIQKSNIHIYYSFNRKLKS